MPYDSRATDAYTPLVTSGRWVPGLLRRQPQRVGVTVGLRSGGGVAVESIETWAWLVGIATLPRDGYENEEVSWQCHPHQLVGLDSW